jgi:hypothetical protein
VTDEEDYRIGEIVTWSGSRWRVDDREDDLFRLVRVDSGPGPLADADDVLEIDCSLVGWCAFV